MPVSPEAIRRYKRQLTIYRDRTSALLIAAWIALPGVDESDIAEFERLTAAPLAGAKSASVSLSAAFTALALRIRPVGVKPRDVKYEADTRGPFRATWHALSEGRPFDEAKQVGLSTASAVAFDFVQHVARLTGDAVSEKAKREVQWRRVPSGNACDWCQEMATFTYASAEAADFGHERCDCDAVPE